MEKQRAMQAAGGALFTLGLINGANGVLAESEKEPQQPAYEVNEEDNHPSSTTLKPTTTTETEASTTTTGPTSTTPEVTLIPPLVITRPSTPEAPPATSAPRRELAHTGETNNALLFTGIGLAAAGVGLVASARHNQR